MKRLLAMKILSRDTEAMSRKSNPFLYKIVSQFLIDKNYPLHIHLELSRSCNYSCQMCARKEMKVKEGLMPAKIATKVIDEMAPYPTSYALHMFGEPLLSPILNYVIDYIVCANPNNKIILVTNGNRPLPGGVHRIYVSIPHLVPGVYYKMTGGGDLEKVKKNILDFLRLKTKTKLMVRYFGEDCTEVGVWKTLGIPFEFKKYHNFAGVQNEWTKLDGKVARYPCYHPFYTLSITFDGSIRVCCSDYKGGLEIGRVDTHSIKQAWSSEWIKNIRMLHKNGGTSLLMCGKCDVWQYKPNIFFGVQYEI